jgi:hypothetical protein
MAFNHDRILGGGEMCGDFIERRARFRSDLA